MNYDYQMAREEALRRKVELVQIKGELYPGGASSKLDLGSPRIPDTFQNPIKINNLYPGGASICQLKIGSPRIGIWYRK